MKRFILLILFTTNCYANYWETIRPKTQDNSEWSLSIGTFWRMSVPHGWLIKNSDTSAITFYPDEKHEWKI